MRADIFVHPDYYHRTKGETVESIGSSAYRKYMDSIKEEMERAEVVVLAYNTGDDTPDCDNDIWARFEKGGQDTDFRL